MLKRKGLLNFANKNGLVEFRNNAKRANTAPEL